MNWKAFTIACVSAAATLFPENGITCGPTEDPHDYFTSFFSNKAGTEAVYKPFYYTSLLKFYDDEDQWINGEDSMASVNGRVAEEWRAYGNDATLNDAIQLVYFTRPENLRALAESLRTGKAVPASLQRNSLAAHFVRNKKTGAVDYLLFVKKTEHVSAASAWEEKGKDSLQINRFIAEANEAFAKASDPFLKNKYAFQRCKLAFYNNRHEDCIRWYNEAFNQSNPSSVQLLALSYKAGSLFRLGKKADAAYHFSQAFAASDQQKKTNYLGFLWATDFASKELIPEYTTRCKNNEEKATMLALFGLYGTDYKLPLLQQVYALQPSSPLLPLLATREINKLEEKYFTPLLSQEKGGKALYVSWDLGDAATDSKAKAEGLSQALETAAFFEKLMQEKNIQQRGLYGAGAAYLRFMAKDYAGAKAVLAKQSAGGDEKIRAQLQLINLLVAANEEKTISKERETQLLPSLKWLVQKAKTDEDYRVFCRNFFAQIMAQQYEQQDDAARAALAYGLSDLPFLQKKEEEDYASSTAIWFARDEMATADLLKLYELITNPATETEKFLVANASIKRDDVIDVIGTSFLRDRNYAKAIEWLGKANRLEPLVETRYNYQTDKSTTINVDPFFDYLNDWQRLGKSALKPYNKLTLARKLQEMETMINKGSAATEEKARLLYQYATALYNMSYYGNSWNAIAYNRSGGDWNHGNYNLPWEKEYYGVQTARDFYQKAYESTKNREFKAACLFMVAKCAQRQIPLPEYNSGNYEAYEKGEAAFQQKFMNNVLFGQFKKEFGTTQFYKYAYNRCSYLRDFVKRSSAPVKDR